MGSVNWVTWKKLFLNLKVEKQLVDCLPQTYSLWSFVISKEKIGNVVQ